MKQKPFLFLFFLLSTIAELRDHIFYLASDELEGRYPGTPGYDKAAEYKLFINMEMRIEGCVICGLGDWEWSAEI